MNNSVNNAATIILLLLHIYFLSTFNIILGIHSVGLHTGGIHGFMDSTWMVTWMVDVIFRRILFVVCERTTKLPSTVLIYYLHIVCMQLIRRVPILKAFHVSLRLDS